MDKSEFTTMQKSLKKILLYITRKGKYQVKCITIVRGTCAASAVGVYILPVIIFKPKKFHNDLKIGTLPSCIVTIWDTRYINAELFVKWLRNFKKHVLTDNKVHALLDGHTTNSKNLQVCEFAKKYEIVLFQLPDHTFYRLKPLSRACFDPLQTLCTQAQKMSTFRNDAYGWTATVEMAYPPPSSSSSAQNAAKIASGSYKAQSK